MQSRSVVRYVLNGVGVILALMFLVGVRGSGWFLTFGLLALFMGVTDFGRQCPLILSVRHLAYRISSKAKPSILSVQTVKETSEGDRKNIPS
ncbi:MAG: hypothetical protein NTU47_00720 [Ignavibacteriales bacterium]|nr:hypothetical protein [Ignavibacteriales bacterium]